MRVLKVTGAVAGLLVLLVASAAFFALRDSPARPAAGDRKLATSGAAEIVYYAAGPTSAPTVLLLPSFGRAASDFNELASILGGAGYRTLAVEPRGIGGSTLPSYDVSLHTFAGDVVAVLDSEQLSEPVHVIGHAYGNRVARAVASDFPERVATLVLFAAGGVAPTPPETGQAVLRALFGLGSRSAREEAVRFGFFARDSTVPEYWVRGWYPRAGIAQTRAMANTAAEEWRSGGRAPILVLEPAEDAAAAGAGAELKHRHPERVRVVEVARAGHALLPERLDVVAREVLAYLSAAR